MENTNWNPNRQIAIGIRGRYEFYLVALTFTILGLSIQTARFGSFVIGDAAELLAWVALLLAGLLGLSGIRAAYALYDVYGTIATDESERREFERLHQTGVRDVRLEGGGTLAPVELVRDRDGHIASAELRAGKINKAQTLGHQVQSIMFVVGVALLVFSRGYQPFQAIFRDPVIYSCADSRTKLPVFFKISSEGFVRITAHYRDGQVYVIGGNLHNYSRISSPRDEIVFEALVSHDSVGLDLETGSFYINDKDGDPIFAGVCKV